MTPVVSRRQILLGLAGIGALSGLSACGRNGESLLDPAAIASAESARPTSGRIRDLTLRARPVQLDLGGTVVTTWGYGDTVPGTLLRATAGDRVRIAFTNDLPEETSVHWHGLAIRNDMDGVPGVTTTPTPAGGTTAFDFTIPHAGTHWFHPHHGMQLDRGLYAPFIVDDPAEPGAYDHEWVVVLDDWTDGVGKSPENIFNDLVAAGSGTGGMNMGGMDMGGQGGGMGMGGMDGGDVAYPLYLINGRVPRDPDVLTAKPGQKVRIRIINSAADTIFTVAVGGHDLSVTHTDGYAVTPVTTSSIRIGMGERYDVVATLGDGVFPFVASPLGKAGIARALIRTGAGSVPAASYLPPEVTAFPLTADALSAAPGTALAKRDPDTVMQLALSGSMQPYVWTINGRTYDQTVPLTISPGQSGRLRITNMSMMSHPVHLHGHTFQLGPAGGSGARKDTVLVPPMGAINVDLLADNPGKWMVHCHNAYHAEAGMMTRLDYVTA